jgi:hypothetical protein
MATGTISAGLALRWLLRWRQLWPLLEADADRVDLESRLIKLMLEDRARVSVCRQRPLMAQTGRSPHRFKPACRRCEGSHDCVGARSKLDDRERFVKKRKCDGVATLQRATPKAKRVEDRRTGVWN